jgi:hypothetical protein
MTLRKGPRSRRGEDFRTNFFEILLGAAVARH